MTAVACMRILVGAELQASGASTLAILVGRIADAFLDSRWSWPRRYGAVAPFAFVLADPRAREVDVHELKTLAEELQTKLFGAEGAGDIVLLAFEGEQADVMRFAAAETSELRQALTGSGSLAGFGGKISRITSHGVESVSTARSQSDAAVAIERSVETPDCRFAGVYFLPRETFIGNGLTARRQLDGRFHNIADGSRQFSEQEATDFDLCCLEAAAHALARMSAGILFVPISFASVIHRSAREIYQPWLDRLPEDQRARLGVTVYDTPRDPSFSALAQAMAFLSPAFGVIDLHVNDPGFEFEKLVAGSVTSITLVLPDADEARRLAAASQFMRARDHYKSKRIWPAVTNVRTRRELDACAALRVPFLTGRAVCDLMRAPVAARSVALDTLPVRDAAEEAHDARVVWLKR
ncbi:hypothetical protein [Phenylobacterium sp.]|uniref:hypothetical protein n=1 Tax=Phenylobacterium sp. TaxID=1871053 RepID=UPI002FC6033E